MKKATQKSSPNHVDSDKYSKGNMNHQDCGNKHIECEILNSNLVFLEDALLFQFAEYWALTQMQYVGCSCPAETHIVDIAPAVQALRKRGYPITDRPGGEGKVYFLDLESFYFSINKGVNND
mgnify:FL=1